MQKENTRTTPYAITYTIAIVASLLVDFLILAPYRFHPTLHVALAFVTFTLVAGVLTLLIEYLNFHQ